MDGIELDLERKKKEGMLFLSEVSLMLKKWPWKCRHEILPIHWCFTHGTYADCKVPEQKTERPFELDDCKMSVGGL